MVGKIKIPAILTLLKKHGMGGEKFLEGFVTGFPSTGSAGAPGVYPTQEVKPPKLTRKTLLEEAPDQVKAFANQRLCAKEHEELLWNEAQEQQKKGWLEGPFFF